MIRFLDIATDAKPKNASAAAAAAAAAADRKPDAPVVVALEATKSKAPRKPKRSS